MQAQDAALEARTQLRIGVQHTDNLGRDAERESRTFGTAGLDLGLSGETPRLTSSIHGSLDYYHYESARFSNEVVGAVDGDLRLALMQNHLFWRAEDRFGQVRQDPFRAQGPGNREYLNIFSTGPDLLVPLGARTRMQASARWTDRRYQRSDRLSSEQISGSLLLERALSPTQVVAVGGNTRRTEYDDLGARPLEIHDAYLRHERQLATGSLALQGGASAMRYTGDLQTGWTALVDWHRNLATRSALNISAGRDFTEVSDLFRRRSLANELADIGDVVLSPDPLTRSWIRTAYTLQRVRSRFGLQVGWTDERREVSRQLDRRYWRIVGRLTRELRADLSATAEIAYREEIYRNADIRADDVTVSGSLHWQVGRQVGLRAAYTHLGRSGRGAPAGYRENRFGLTVTWVPGDP